MKDSEVLALAAGVIDNGFTQHLYARTKDGEPSCPTDPAATCFCMVGAICRVLATEYTTAGDDIVNKWVVPLIPKRQLHQLAFEGSARAWNDDPTRTQSQVAAKLREAAAVAEKAGA